jgi:hypothetical protein
MWPGFVMIVQMRELVIHYFSEQIMTFGRGTAGPPLKTVADRFAGGAGYMNDSDNHTWRTMVPLSIRFVGR